MKYTNFPYIRFIPLLVGIVYLSEAHLKFFLQILISVSVAGILAMITISKIRRSRCEDIPPDNKEPLSHYVWHIAVISSLFLCLLYGAIRSRSPLVIMLACIAAVLTIQVLLRKRKLSELTELWSFLWLSAAVMSGHIIYWNYLSVFEYKWLMDFESIVINGISRLFPVSSSTIDQYLVLSGQQIHFSAFDIHAGLPVIFAFFVLSEDKNFIRIIKAFLSVIGIIIIGFLWVLLLLYTDQQQLFFSSAGYFIMLIISYLFAMVLWRSSTLNFTIQSKGIIICIIIAICLYILPGFAGWGAANGIHKIAIDESHGSWETTQAKFDTVNYGRDTVYNYAMLRKHLGSMYDVRLLTKKITNIDADLIIVKTPVEFYSLEEKQVIENFVKDGGALLVIGDHTNLFGHTMVVNDLLDWTGMRLNTDATVSLDAPHYDFRTHWWNQHSILHGIDRIEFQTLATISGSTPYIFPFIVGDRIVAEGADYSNERFFGELTPDVSDRQPPLVLGAYRYIGKGKVILFGDSTIWSNFSFFAATNEALLDNLINACWVKVGLISRLLILIFGIGILVAVYLFCKDWVNTLMIFLVVPILVFSWHSNLLDNTEVVDTTRNENRVFVDGVHSNMELRADIRKENKDDLYDYSTFYAWLSRINLFPRITKRQCYESSTVPVIIINPDKPFDGFEISKIDAYLREGGRILLLDDPMFAYRSTADSLLGYFGISYKAGFSGNGIYDPEGPALSENLLGVPFDILYGGKMSRGKSRASESSVGYHLSGTTALLVDEEGFVICGQKEIGRGVITVFYRSSTFSEFIMGDVWGGKEPGESKLQLYNLAYSLVNSSIGGKVK